MGRNSKKVQTLRSNNPPRGGPGVLVVGDTGRESKCKREALEILSHYYFKNENEESSKQSGPITTDGGNGNEDKRLTLEEELALLQKGASADAVLQSDKQKGGKGWQKSPFREYTTGCKGTTFLMCTNKDCELIKTTISTAKTHHEKMNVKSQETPLSGTKRASTDEEDISEDTVQVSKKQKVESTTEKEEISKGEATQCIPKNKWDPIQTVHDIFEDVRNNDTTAPRSRFVTRLIPIQATCFVSLEEIEANVGELIKTFLIPLGIDNIKKLEEQGRLKGRDEYKSLLPSFKIDLKKRHCNQIRRNTIIDMIAKIIEAETSKFWEDHSELRSKLSEDENKCPDLFKVDLSNAKHTIIIEICRTLCGMAVVENAKEYRNFNLLTVQEETMKEKSEIEN
ncbi:hypothetical protein CTEN210_05124 [Chaetoceros tenuissimus]|uniref:THUMP domain-containing protein n=1 Tax=Chaetoceros tenuissimus TaxID=426638 RepID=A0AAD3H3F1_9STRA|nr:hypothetical protein CTEN210_05124 [Chaetoceros tenuissimus]